MENDTLHGFRLRMAVFARMVNEMIVAQLAEEARASEAPERPAELALASHSSHRPG
jgi:hypothetical protein